MRENEGDFMKERCYACKNPFSRGDFVSIVNNAQDNLHQQQLLRWAHSISITRLCPQFVRPSYCQIGPIVYCGCINSRLTLIRGYLDYRSICYCNIFIFHGPLKIFTNIKQTKFCLISFSFSLSLSGRNKKYLSC